MSAPPGAEAAAKAAWDSILLKASSKAPSPLVIGVGSGTTIIPFVSQIPTPSPHIFLPSSWQSRALLAQKGVRIGELNDWPCVDVAVDGCDHFQVSDAFGVMVVKGGGGCLLQEKMILEASASRIILASDAKRTRDLVLAKITIEVHPKALQLVLWKIESGLEGVVASVREGSGKVGPVVTDNGNFLVDIQMDGPSCTLVELEEFLTRIPGVLETGIFVEYCDTLIAFTEGGKLTVHH